MSNLPELTNYLTLQHLFNSTIPVFLRQYVAKYWNHFFAKESLPNGEWKNSNGFFTQLFSPAGLGHAFYGWNPKSQEILKHGNISLWDFPLLVAFVDYLQLHPKILNNCDCGDHSKIFPLSTGLQRLLIIWEKIERQESSYLDKEEFNTYLAEVEKILMTRYAVHKKELNVKVTLPSKISPGDQVLPDSANSKQAESLKLAGNTSFASQKYQYAIESYDEALSLEGLSLDLLSILFSNRAVAHLNLGNLKDAKHSAKCSITLAPLWFKGYRRLGLIYEAGRKNAKALKQYQIAAALETGKLLDNSTALGNISPNCLIDSSKAQRDREAQYLTARAHAAEGDKYLQGISCQKDIKLAFKSYSVAAGFGAAVGLWKLGKGLMIKGETFEAFHLLKVAAEMKDGILFLIPDKQLVRNVGVAEAQFELGKFAEDNVNSEYSEDSYIIACYWYRKALDNGNISSIAKLAALHKKFGDIEVVEKYIKLGTYLGDTESNELLVAHYLEAGNLEMANMWRKYPLLTAIVPREMGPIKQLLASELSDTDVGGLLDLKSKYTDEDGEIYKMFMKVKITPDRQPFTLDQKSIILKHRASVQAFPQQLKSIPLALRSIQPTELGPTKSQEDTTAITFREMDTSERDKIYWDRVLRVVVVEDVAFGMSFRLLVKDEEDQVFLLYVLYPKRKTIHDEIGYGCGLTLINPHYRVMSDGMKTVIVNVPESVVTHPEKRDAKMCRCCWKGSGQLGNKELQCENCKRACYCSEECKKIDKEELKHDLVCFEQLYDFTRDA